ncbi:MAG: TolC family protein, partial [Cyclobacteriaceae bacterium]|nr:TolC family protein [Cyclobacteriaceae bacterium]
PVLSNSNLEVPTGQFIDGYVFMDQMNDNLSKSVSLNLNIPIFGKFFNRDEIQKSMIREEQASINLERAKNELRQVIERAFNDVLASAKSYSVALKQVEAREESFRVTQQRYNLGAADYFAYQLAETDLYRSKSDLLRMKYDFIFKKNILDFYMGNELDF